MKNLLTKSLFQILLISIILSCSIFFAKAYHKSSPIFEEGAYGRYTISLINDGDLNILNQASKRSKWMMTKTINHPDMHNGGIPVLLAPFFLYKKMTMLLFDNHNFNSIEQFTTVHILSTIFFAALILILTLKMTNLLFKRPHKTFVLLLFLGTPFFWYTFFDATTIDVHGAFIATIILLLYFHIIKKENPGKIELFAFGTLIAFGTICRPQLFFYNILLVDYLFLHQKSFRKKFSEIISYAAGSGCIWFAYFVNAYIQYGHIDYVYRHVTEKTFFHLPSMLFGPNGYIYLSPIYLLCGTGLIYLIIKKDNLNLNIRTSLFLLIAIIPIIQVVATSFKIMDNDQTFGGRLLIEHFTAFAILIMVFQQPIRKYLLSLSILSVIWHFVIMWWYQYEDSKTDYTWGLDYINNLHFITGNSETLSYKIQNAVNDFTNNTQEIIHLYPLILLSSFAIFKIIKIKDLATPNTKKNLIIVSMFFFLAYIGITISNKCLNSSNSAKFDTSDISKMVMGNGMEIYIYDDYIEVSNRAIKYYELRDELEKSKQVKTLQNKYLNIIKQQILKDPINFKKDIENGIVRPSYWDM